MFRGYTNDSYMLQKRIAEKSIKMAKSLRGTESYKEFSRVARIEMSNCMFMAEALGIIRR